MDYYKVLGLPLSSANDKVKEAFRWLAVKCHPDKHSLSSRSVRDNATLRFKQVSEAYDVLVDDLKRSECNISTGGRSYYWNCGFGVGGGGGGGRSSGEGYGYGALLGAAVVIDRGRDTLRKMRNSGKSFEDAMEFNKKAKAQNSRR